MIDVRRIKKMVHAFAPKSKHKKKKKLCFRLALLACRLMFGLDHSCPGYPSWPNINSDKKRMTKSQKIPHLCSSNIYLLITTFEWKTFIGRRDQHTERPPEHNERTKNTERFFDLIQKLERQSRSLSSSFHPLWHGLQMSEPIERTLRET